MPNLADKLAKQFRVYAGGLITVEAAAAAVLLFFAPLEANVILFLFILGASISISGWACYGTRKKNPRLMRMYIGSNLGCFVSIVLSVAALAIILFASSQSGEHDMMDLQTASGEGLSRPLMPLYQDGIPIADGQPLHHGNHSAASSAAFCFGMLAMFLGWFCLKVVSMVVAWRLTKLWAGRHQCPKYRQMAPMPKAAYAPTPYFIVVPQGQSAYVAPKAQQV